MKPVTLERWVWVLIYGGMLLSMLGMWTFDARPDLAWPLLGLGGFAAALGVAGVLWRARMDRRTRAGSPR